MRACIHKHGVLISSQQPLVICTGPGLGVSAVSCGAKAGICSCQEAPGNGFYAHDQGLPGEAGWREDSEGDLYLCCCQGQTPRGFASAGDLALIFTWHASLHACAMAHLTLPNDRPIQVCCLLSGQHAKHSEYSYM